MLVAMGNQVFQTHISKICSKLRWAILLISIITKNQPTRTNLEINHISWYHNITVTMSKNTITMKYINQRNLNKLRSSKIRIRPLIKNNQIWWWKCSIRNISMIIWQMLRSSNPGSCPTAQFWMCKDRPFKMRKSTKRTNLSRRGF